MADEFSLHIPDALLNGTATVKLIESCCPSINNAWDTPICDVSAILIGIQLASHLGKSDLNVICPKCKEELTYSLNLTSTLSSFNADIWSEEIEVDGLFFSFKPPSYKTFNEYNINNFKYQKTVFHIKQLNAALITENILDLLTSSTIELQQQILEASISSITSPGKFRVENLSFISDYLRDAEHEVMSKLAEHLTRCIASINPPNLDIQCSGCNFQMKAPLNLDPSVSFRNRIIQLSEEEVVSTITRLEKENRNLRADIFKMMWYMRGSINIEQAMSLSNQDRIAISKIIDENLELTKTTHLPFI